MSEDHKQFKLTKKSIICRACTGSVYTRLDVFNVKIKAIRLLKLLVMVVRNTYSVTLFAVGMISHLCLAAPFAIKHITCSGNAMKTITHFSSPLVTSSHEMDVITRCFSVLDVAFVSGVFDCSLYYYKAAKTRRVNQK